MTLAPLLACSAWIGLAGFTYGVATSFFSDTTIGPTAAFDKYAILQNLVAIVAILLSVCAVFSATFKWVGDLRLITKIKFSLVALACLYLIFFALHYNILGPAHRY